MKIVNCEAGQLTNANAVGMARPYVLVLSVQFCVHLWLGPI